MRAEIIFLALAPIILCYCTKSDINNSDNLEFEAEYSKNDLVFNNQFYLYNQNVLAHKLTEASGIVTGRTNKGLVYIHEDSGNRPVVFVYDKYGNFKGEIILAGIDNRDWEDIAIGPGPDKGENYIYIGDIGDNKSARPHLCIYRFQEPDLSDILSDSAFKIVISGDKYDLINFQYPDGARNAETLMVNPANSSLIIISKMEINVHVYELPFPQRTARTSGKNAKVNFKGKLPFRNIVGGDIAPDGDKMLIKDYGKIYYWDSIPYNGDIIQHIFTNAPQEILYIPEVQGEAVGFTSCGKGYLAITEIKKHKVEPILYHYMAKNGSEASK
jgi:hypothetical protein